MQAKEQQKVLLCDYYKKQLLSPTSLYLSYKFIYSF